MIALDSYRKHLIGQLSDLQEQLSNVQQVDYYGPLGDDLKKQFEAHLAALNLLNSYVAKNQVPNASNVA